MSIFLPYSLKSQNYTSRKDSLTTAGADLAVIRSVTAEIAEKDFSAKTGHDIPASVNWDDQAYREWIRWNYRRRLEIWDPE